MYTLTIGTRGSSLARAQAGWVEEQILAAFPETRIQTRIITTSADRDTVTSIRSGSGTGVFVREIEEALLSGHIDLAVHSMKDLPTKIPEDLEIGAIPAREDARDALIAGAKCHALEDLPHGAVLGTGSIRRQAQILARRPDLVAKDIRGNVQTRLQKLATGSYDAILLACAGLNRLGLEGRISARFEFLDMLPAPGQGALALEVRKRDRRVADLIACLHDPAVACAVLAERAFLRRMGGGCNSPIAVHACIAGDGYLIDGLVASPDGAIIVRDQVRTAATEAVRAADALAEKILATGGSAILQSLR